MITLGIAGSLAFTSAFVAFLGMVFIGIFMKAGEPYGSLNDISIALQVVLIVPVAFYLHDKLSGTRFTTLSGFGLGILVLGAIPLAVGSILLVMKKISLEQSFRPPFNGYWLIGIWMIIASLLAIRAQIFSTWNGWLGVAIGSAWIILGLTMWIGGPQAQQSMPMVLSGSLGMLGYIVWTALLGYALFQSVGG